MNRRGNCRSRIEEKRYWRSIIEEKRKLEEKNKRGNWRSIE